MNELYDAEVVINVGFIAHFSRRYFMTYLVRLMSTKTSNSLLRNNNNSKNTKEKERYIITQEKFLSITIDMIDIWLAFCLDFL